MTDPVTPNLGLTKPTVGADLDGWGDIWNANADTLDADVVRKAGDTMTGALTVQGAQITVAAATAATTATYISLIPTDFSPGSAKTGLVLQKTGASQWTLSQTDGTTTYGELLFNGTTTSFGTDIRPSTDGSNNCGQPARRWNTYYGVTGTISTSDAREKDWRGELNDAELRVAKRLASSIGIYQWKTAVAEKGPDGARLHTGWLAQTVRDAFTAEGLDGTRYGLLCYDKWEAEAARPEVAAVDEVRDPQSGEIVTPYQPPVPAVAGIDAGDRWSIRPDELTAFVLAGQEQRLAALEAAAANGAG